MTHRFRFVLLLWLACACALAGVPERPRFRVAGPAQGLPSSEIKALARDADGYLWIGTVDGLARFDGVGMRVWRYAPDAGGGLPGNHVQALLVDAADRIWVAVEGEGVSVLDASRQRFTHYRKATHPSLVSDDVWALSRQGDAVWLGTYDGGLTRIDASGAMRHFSAARDGLPSDTILALATDADGVLWVGTTAGLARRRGDGAFERVALPGAEGEPMVYTLAQQPDGLWVGTSAGVWRHARGSWAQPAWSPMFHRPNAMMALATDPRGDRWIGSQRGLWHQRGDAPPVPVPLGGPDIPRAVSTLSIERDGALWVPLMGLGLGYLRSDWRQLAEFHGAADGLQGGIYRALGKAGDGGAWLGGLGGVIEHMDADGAVAALGADALERLRNVKLAAIAEDAARRLWVSHRGGLIRIGTDGAIDEWTASDAQAPAPSSLVTRLLPARDGSLWLAAPGAGVQQRDAATGAILRDMPAGSVGGLGDADIEDMALAPAGEPWLATSTGLLRFDAAGRRFQPQPGLGSERAFALAFDGANKLWVQRLSGLERYRLGAAGWSRVERIDARFGMPAVAAAALLVDARGRVWITTSRGLYRWEPTRRNLRRIGTRDAGGSEEYLDRAALLRDDGVLVAATADGGLRLVETGAADAAALRPVLRFDGIAVRREGEWQALPPLPGVVLGNEDREFRVRARLLAFDDPAGNRYWSRLDGFDGSWVALGASGERVFTGLAPGRYVLRIRGQDAAGNAAAEQQLAFVVSPPWWRSGWALAAWALATLSLLAWLALAYRQRLKRRHAWQLAEHKRTLAEQASQAKSRFLATLGHEVRTPMTGVLGMAELLQGTPLDTQQRGHVEAIRRAGEHLLRLVNDALDMARIEAGRLELVDAPFALKPLLGEVAGLMAPLAERKGLVFAEHVDADAPRALQGDRTRVQQILLNLIGNAVKFTEAGHVSLEVSALQPQGVRFVVADSGPGLNPEQRERLFRRFEQADGARTAARYGGSGLGLAISQELAAAMGGRITVESAPGQGTRFLVELPLSPVANAPGAAPSAIPLAGAASVPTLQLLLVEDDPIVAQAIAGLLRAQGHVVAHAGHGLGALTEAATRRFDAALLDLDLPGMDGLALARALRDRGFAAPLLAVTARSDGEAEAQARAAGFDGFLRKPVTGEMLGQALETLLAAAV
ncbi:hybrid sensor histidine kinase/response regulator [Thermomonas fusca]|uniref:histidine kinase n=1 Tax=Thermomonas fusca TaxID=215690 RepID=A0A5R9PJI1_9GAMM|nr:hybrid sensor histidine kinase/response regulator [Thermomonas fusca]TLX23197.1 hybrid sensor histidine kinase/response regulator [Thermomonas fusca]